MSKRKPPPTVNGQSTRQADGRPWYREPWPWILMAGPATVVVAGLFTYWIAATTFDGMVADDYYKQGLAINKVIARDQAATRLGLRAEVALEREGTRVRVALAGSGVPGERRLRLRVVHPARADLDQTVILERVGDRYEGQVESLRPGRWTASLEDEAGTWRMAAVWRIPQESVLHLEAASELPR